ncbi:hypothetical protein L7F22_056124 [Adiantum nelumboides]|nr:hypothetical protein [Adiantum nelumboides]
MGNTFDKDGPATQFCESLPVVGYVASMAHGIAGNEEHAKRAAAKCTNATVTTICTVGGGLLGGPAGAMAGAAAGNAIGIGAEHGVSHHISDSAVRAHVGSVEATRFVTDMGLSAVGGGMGNIASGAVGKGSVKQFVAGQAASGTFAGVPKALK